MPELGFLGLALLVWLPQSYLSEQPLPLEPLAFEDVFSLAGCLFWRI